MNQQTDSHDLDYIVGCEFRKNRRGNFIREDPNYLIKWKEIDKVDKIKAHQFTSQQIITDYFLDREFSMKSGRPTSPLYD